MPVLGWQATRKREGVKLGVLGYSLLAIGRSHKANRSESHATSFHCPLFDTQGVGEAGCTCVCVCLYVGGRVWACM